MKPNFALTLSFEGISLLHRAFPGWHMVGEVSLDNTDLTGALSDLRQRAEDLDSNPIRSKLVVPNDQIRFIQFDSEGLEPDEIASAVHRALNGATPYAVDDLAYDWSISAGQVHVAAVARETLTEAEAFATEHGFNPLCFVAVPKGRDFVGEPWFGETKAAPSLLPEGGRIDRDTAAIRVIGIAPMPAATADAAPEADLEGAPEAGASPDPEVPPTPEPDLPPPPRPEVPPAPQPDLPPQPEPEVPPVPGTPPAPDPEIEPDTDPVPDIPPEPTPTPDPDIPPSPTPGLGDEDAVTQASPKDTGPETQNEGAEAVAEKPADPPAPDAAPAVAFSSIRARRDELPTVPRRLTGATRDAATPSAETPASEAPRAEPTLTAAPLPTADTAAVKVTGRPQYALPADAAARIGASLRPSDDSRLAPADDDLPQNDGVAAAPVPDDPDDGADIPPPPAFMADRTDPAPFDLPDDTPNAPLAAPAVARSSPSAAPPSGPLSFFSRRKAPKPDKRQAARTATRPTPEAQREQERQRMTVFGARKSASVGGKPRFLGLILTAVLLIFLVGVAAWASIFLEDGISRVLRGDPDPQEQIAATPDAELPPRDTATAPETEAEEDGESVLAALPGVTSDGAEPTRADPQPEPSPAELTDQQARTRYAVTGIWQRAPDAPSDPGAQTLDDFYLTSIDPKVVEQDAVALPAPESLRGDTRPDTPADPAAADTMFTMDTRGLVQPTPEGATSPDGVLVYAGQPALVPPDRPAETLAQPGEDPAEAAARIEALERIAALRPRVRPGDLAETNQRETLGGRTRDELASLRPRLRPQSAQQLAEQAAASTAAEAAAAATSEAVSPDPEAVNAAVQAAAAVPAPDPFAGATAQAVKVSVKPNVRPRNFDRIVQRSKRLAEQQEARTAATAVPRNQRISPSGPTPTTVARAATEKNALRMRRVNLIGVYGSNSNRRALVRLANGSYKKVKVGDRLDGGRVAAIGTSELRYVKSGRSVTLTMPRG